MVVFRFAQPLLISRTIRFVTHFSAAGDDYGAYWLVIEATVVYVGMAVSVLYGLFIDCCYQQIRRLTALGQASTSVYQHRVNRLEVLIRGAMVSLIHSRALDVRNSKAEDDGKVATLVSNDISNMEDSARMFHETWAQFVEVVIGTFLLSRQVGWLWPLPLVLIFCKKYSDHSRVRWPLT